MSLLDDYRLLELDINATEQDAKAAYRHLAHLYHPDKNPDRDTTEHFQSLHTAYQNVLAAIRQGLIIQDWQRYDFTAGSTSPFDAPSSESKEESDEVQRQYIRERQRAYEEMKRNTLNQERAREAALRRARNTINEKKAKEIYEQAFKNGITPEKTSEKSKEDVIEQDDVDFGIDPSLFSTFDHIIHENEDEHIETINLDSHSLTPVKAAVRAVSYLVTFALGVYAAVYWQNTVEETSPNKDKVTKTTFVAGLYPQYRNAINHTFADVNLYVAPDSSTPIITSIPKFSDVFVTNSSRDNWLSVRYGDKAGWVEESNIGFGTAHQANRLHCVGTPGVAPAHGKVISPLDVNGNSRMRLINQLPSHSILTFESYEGAAPFSIYLNTRQSLAVNYIPKGRYRLLLNSGSLFHNDCQQFLFDQESRVLVDQIEFTSAEQTLTLEQQ